MVESMKFLWCHRLEKGTQPRKFRGEKAGTLTEGAEGKDGPSEMGIGMDQNGLE